MNYINTLKGRLALVLMVLFGANMGTRADNVLSIEDFSIAAGETKEVSLNLDNTDTDLTGFDGYITVPEGLTLVKNAYGTGKHASFQRGLSIGNLTPSTGKFAVAGSVTGVTGTVMKFKVQATDDLAATSKLNVSVVLKKNGADLPESNISATVTRTDAGASDDPGIDPETDELSATINPTSLQLEAGETKDIEVLLTNGFSLSGFAAVVKASEGITIDKVVKGERVEATLGGYNASTGKIAYMGNITGKEGVLFTITVTAAEDFAKDATLTITDFAVTNTSSKETEIEPLSLTISSAAAAELAANKAAFDEYKAEQEAASKALAEDGDSEASQKLIADAVAAIEALTYDEAKTLDENKAAVDEIVAALKENLAAQREADEAAANKAAFDEYKAEQEAASKALAEDGDSEASQKLIADAVAAIETLTYDVTKSLDQNKEAVDDIVAKLKEDLAAQRAAEQAAADEAAAKAAFDEYKAEQEAASKALAEDGDSEASQKLIADAVAAIDALTYDVTKSLDENKEAVDAIVNKLKEDLAAQRAADKAEADAAAQLAADKKAFEEYKAEQEDAAEAMAEDGDSEASQKLIADAVAAIEALTYDEAKTLAENKEAVDEIIDALKEDLAAQREADKENLGDADLIYDALKYQYFKLRKQFEDLVEYLGEECADVEANYADDLEEIEALLDAANEKLEADYAGGKLTNSSTLLNASKIAALIEKVKEQATAAQKAHDTTTGITAIKAKYGENVEIYTISGKKVMTDQLRKGIYIINGQKVVVK
ncbi:MAG: hypothetical protein IJ570_03270 [Prevotella sp.]|nr:hypothetical protein [Prevotella sp.]